MDKKDFTLNLGFVFFKYNVDGWVLQFWNGLFLGFAWYGNSNARRNTALIAMYKHLESATYRWCVDWHRPSKHDKLQLLTRNKHLYKLIVPYIGKFVLSRQDHYFVYHDGFRRCNNCTLKIPYVSENASKPLCGRCRVKFNNR